MPLLNVRSDMHYGYQVLTMPVILLRSVPMARALLRDRYKTLCCSHGHSRSQALRDTLLATFRS